MDTPTAPAPLAEMIVPAETVTRSGFVAYFPHADQTYSLGTLLCDCPAITITLRTDGTPQDFIDATYTCPVHGTHRAAAIWCSPLNHTVSAAFAWVEQRHARDRRVQWGMSRRTS